MAPRTAKIGAGRTIANFAFLTLWESDAAFPADAEEVAALEEFARDENERLRPLGAPMARSASQTNMKWQQSGSHVRQRSPASDPSFVPESTSAGRCISRKGFIGQAPGCCERDGTDVCLGLERQPQRGRSDPTEWITAAQASGRLPERGARRPGRVR